MAFKRVTSDELCGAITSGDPWKNLGTSISAAWAVVQINIFVWFLATGPQFLQEVTQSKPKKSLAMAWLVFRQKWEPIAPLPGSDSQI